MLAKANFMFAKLFTINDPLNINNDTKNDTIPTII